MKSISAVLFLSLLCITSSLFANQTPRGLASDSRLKIIPYNRDDVVTIRGSHLINTTVQFGKAEVINGITVGDALAWATNFNKAVPYLLNIKPTLPASDTNMTVTTNQHIYQFHLITTPKDTPSSRGVTYALRFSYSGEEQQLINANLKGLQTSLLGDTSTPTKWNDKYTFVGDKAIAPIKAIDNGTFTVFQFRDKKDIPAIFVVDKDRNEALVNFRVQDSSVFIQKVAHQFTLRNGNYVTTVYNEAAED